MSCTTTTELEAMAEHEWKEEEIDRKRNKLEELEHSISDFDNDDPDIARLYSMASGKARHLARRLICWRGDFERGQEILGTAAQHEIMTVRKRRLLDDDLSEFNGAWKGIVGRSEDSMYYALASGDHELQREAAEESLALPEEYLAVFPQQAPLFYFTKALAATIIDDGNAEELLAETVHNTEIIDGYEITGPYNIYAEPGDGITEPGLFAALEGIITGDEDAIVDGIEMHAEFFSNDALAEDDVDIRALGMLVLARQHGYDIDIPSSHVPEQLVSP